MVGLPEPPAPGRRESVEKLESDKDALLESVIAMTPEAFDGLAPEERRRKMMEPKAVTLLDGGLEVNSNSAAANQVGALETASWR